MTRSELIRTVAQRAEVPHAMAQSAVEVVFDEIARALTKGRRVELRGFGTFQVRRYQGYQGHNPRTGGVVEVQPKDLPVFRPGKELREKLNPSGDQG
jgi:integration host factor subunit beta